MIGFKDLVTTWDLTAFHLPRIETPFFAADSARSLVTESDIVRSQVRSVLSYGLSGGTDEAEAVYQAVLRGDLFLVHTGLDLPSFPLVTWQSDANLPSGGQWRLDSSKLPFSGQLKTAVAELNANGITREQLNDFSSGGVASLKARMFSANYRQWQRQEREAQAGGSGNRLTLPLGAAGSVAPLPSTEPDAEEPRQTEPELHLEVGLFTDGTMNNVANAQSFAQQLEQNCLAPLENGEIDRGECEWRMGLMLGDSYANSATNVAKLWGLYIEGREESDGVATYRRKVYSPGAGTKTGDSDEWYGAATGMGEAGVLSQIDYAFSLLALQAEEASQGAAIDRLTIDLFGFSRGAAAARHAVHEINRGESGQLAKMLAERRIAWPREVKIRFVGLFDSVAAIVNPAGGDLSAHNDRNEPVKLYLDPEKVDQAVHLTAAHERRKNFALNSLRSRDGTLPENFREITLPGAHSDVGGGYADSQREEVLLSPRLTVPRNRQRWPDKTMEWDNLELERQQRLAEGWIGPYNLSVRQSDTLQPRPQELGTEGDAKLEIVTVSREHPVPDGQTELVLRMLRQVRGEYSRVGLKIMHRLATGIGAPLKGINTMSEGNDVPTELEPVMHHLLEQIVQGDNSPSLPPAHQDLLTQRYIHYSANYNSLDTLVNGVPAKLEMFHPHGPTASGERLVYPQEKGQ